jgi:hypothetical protein
MKKKIAIIGAVLLVLVVLGVWAVPAFAADPPGSTAPSTLQVNKVRILARLLLVQDEAKVDAFIAKARDADKITADQATKIKEFWTNHHQQFTRRVVLTRLLLARDGAKVQAFLDKAVAAGKIDETQAEKVMTLWNELHSK